MTHLRVEQNTITENVTSDVIHKLYENAKVIIDDEELNEVEESQVSLSGNLQTPIAYRDEIDWLEDKFPNLHILASDLAIKFVDHEVQRVLVNHGVGSNGMITLGQAATVTNIVDWFKENATITTLNDLSYFTNLRVIGSGAAFMNCTSLTSVNLPNVTTLGHNTFLNCTALQTVNLPGLTLLDGVQQFRGCTNLEQVDIGSVKIISQDCFLNCKALKSVNSGDITSIANDGFYNCSSLTSINTSNCISIGSSAFYGCSALTSIDLSKCSSVPFAAFNGCSLLSNVTLGSNIASISQNSFRECKSLTSITIPASVTEIGVDAFTNSGLASITFEPNSRLTTLGGGCFNSCKFSTIDIPDSCTQMTGGNTFFNMNTLVLIKIGTGMTSMTNPFRFLKSNFTLVMRAVTPPTLLFPQGVDKSPIAIYVPDDSVDAYKAAENWSTYSNVIHPISEYVE